MPRIFYRIVKDVPLSVRDFLSHVALGKDCPRSDPTFCHEWEGVSVFDTFEVARDVAEGRRWKLGTFVAELRIPDDAPFTLEGPGGRGHWLLYDRDGGRSYSRARPSWPLTRRMPRTFRPERCSSSSGHPGRVVECPSAERSP